MLNMLTYCIRVNMLLDTPAESYTLVKMFVRMKDRSAIHFQ